jgi:hypothetical protein
MQAWLLGIAEGVVLRRAANKKQARIGGVSVSAAAVEYPPACHPMDAGRALMPCATEERASAARARLGRTLRRALLH